MDRTAGRTGAGGPAPITVEPSREARVGAATVRRALPRRRRRTIGAWCFADHIGPDTVDDGSGSSGPGGIGPHPHIGLQTVTWLLAGELLHRDSLGSEQSVRPGQLNLMTAGHGIAHAEESRTPSGATVHGIQLWVAQPEATRDGGSDFEHHDELPRTELDHGEATVLVGELLGARSSARADTDHHGAELRLRPGTSTVPLRTDHEHALIVLEGEASVGGHDGRRLVPGEVALVDPGRDELALAATGPTTLMLLGGSPFPDPVHMWWNFVGRDRAAIDRAWSDWTAGADRFGPTGSPMERIEVGAPPWQHG
ncbi:pirin family protein [Dermatobacter hominis]|uniref:pirin family protein n=1 Tax=Dermatobacter hominis TaxID=2884263 RepID=UPI001D12F108|nr:pirin family protein [Dermatobacter hominis]UDY34319.1 pirin family protein [Dermatobacter hominis]